MLIRSYPKNNNADNDYSHDDYKYKNNIYEINIISKLLQDRDQTIKRQRTTCNVPVVYARLRINKDEMKTIKVLLDSGSSETLIASNLVRKFNEIKTEDAM